MTKENIKKAFIEAGRVVVISIIPNFIASMNIATGEIKINWAIIAVTGAITLLKFADKLLHEVGKSTGSAVLVKGITRF